jgi:Na+/proline symporter
VDYWIILVSILVVGGIGRVLQKHVKSASDFLTSARRLLQ